MTKCDFYVLLLCFKYEICNRIWLKENQLIQLNFETIRSQLAIMCPAQYSGVQYAKPWPYFDIRYCCFQSVHSFTSRYDSTFFGCTFFTLKVFLHEIFYLTWTSIQLGAVNCYKTGWLMDHLFSCFVGYVELSTAPVNTFLGLYLWLPTILHLCTNIHKHLHY